MSDIYVHNTPANRVGVLALWMAAHPQCLISHSMGEAGELSITASLKGESVTASFHPNEQGLSEPDNTQIVLTSDIL